ncbi:MAG TPA: epoxyqueuosine reductase [Firmicutes bacterium]|nr:epoxyqueuosine reductase [Bacillota bacterium]
MSASKTGELQEILEKTVQRMIRGFTGKTRYREPVFGYASASDPRFAQLRRDMVPGHLLPQHLLPEARSVFCFFVPFEGSVVAANRKSSLCADEWAIAYEETNALLSQICETLTQELGKLGVAAAWLQPTRNFDPVALRSAWSHKSVAVIAGLGTLGLHQMLITERGCAGRVGSIVTSADLPLNPPKWHAKELCGFYQGGKCKSCISLCPVGAIHEPHGDRISLDKSRCHAQCLRVHEYFSGDRGFHGTFDICGKCATGPCSLTSFC